MRNHRIENTAVAVAFVASLLALPCSAAEGDAAQPGTEPATKCKLEDVGQPQRSQDNAAKKVTFKGRIRNAGDAVAKGVRVRFQIRGATDDFVAGEEAVATQPADIDPGGEASYSVSATWTGVAAHGGGKEVLTREMDGCDAPRPEFGVSGKGYCELSFVGTPSRSGTKTRGEIENAGPGMARDVVVAIVKPDATSVPKGTPHVTATPASLAPGARGSFELEAPGSASEGTVRIVGYDCQPIE